MQNWDGSGGNGAALRHFEATGSKYPLVVKLGTITPHGADVFSYAPDENDMVEDPKLVCDINKTNNKLLAVAVAAVLMSISMVHGQAIHTCAHTGMLGAFCVSRGPGGHLTPMLAVGRASVTLGHHYDDHAKD